MTCEPVAQPASVRISIEDNSVFLIGKATVLPATEKYKIILDSRRITRYTGKQMSETLTKKPRRKLTSLELPAPARGALRRIKQVHGINHTAAISRGVIELEAKLNKGVEI